MAEERVQRRLAAVMAADVVGYSRLSEADEAGTRARLRVLHLELLDPLIAADGGRIVKTMGDGILIEFPSVVDAVHSALAIQNAMRLRNVFISEEIRMELRIGVNTGDVIIEDDDIHGDGVNVAARLEQSNKDFNTDISFSHEIYTALTKKLYQQATLSGEIQLKGRSSATKVYTFKPSGEP